MVVDFKTDDELGEVEVKRVIEVEGAGVERFETGKKRLGVVLRLSRSRVGWVRQGAQVVCEPGVQPRVGVACEVRVQVVGNRLECLAHCDGR